MMPWQKATKVYLRHEFVCLAMTEGVNIREKHFTDDEGYKMTEALNKGD
jgi:hypothetical protein